MYKFFSLITTLLFINLHPVFGQKDWQLIKEYKEIKIYTGLIDGSEVKAVKVECEFHAKASEMVNLLLDVESATEWVYHTKLCKLIKKVSPSELYYYSEVDLPWPVSNRDFVAHLTVTQNPKTKVVVINGPSVNGFVPNKKGIVRINNSTGKWILTPIKNNQLKIEYTLHVDPGGSVPAWIINLFAAEGPLHIFRNLKTQLLKPRYKNVELDFIRN